MPQRFAGSSITTPRKLVVRVDYPSRDESAAHHRRVVRETNAGFGSGSSRVFPFDRYVFTVDTALSLQNPFERCARRTRSWRTSDRFAMLRRFHGKFLTSPRDPLYIDRIHSRFHVHRRGLVPPSDFSPPRTARELRSMFTNSSPDRRDTVNASPCTNIFTHLGP